MIVFVQIENLELPLYLRLNGLSSKYLKFIDMALQVTRYSRFPLYSCKYSKQTYTQHRLLTLILFKEYLGEDIEILLLTREKFGSIAIVPLRQHKRKLIKGRYQKKMLHEFDSKIYSMQNLSETMFSVLKIKYGENLRQESTEIK